LLPSSHRPVSVCPFIHKFNSNDITFFRFNTMLVFSLLAVVSAGLVAAQTGVVGSAAGFASGVTGGGEATPAAPADIDELVSWLTDDEPRVILLDKEYNFLDSEGTTTENGCRPDSNTCGTKGQDALDGPNWCSASYPTVEVTYDVAATKPIDIKSNKSIVGIGAKGVIRGKGFRVVSGAQNIIFQNFHITDLNPQYIWGGDAIQLSGTDLIWIDHMKFSLVGRQFLVTGYESAGRVTVSNSEFDGKTSWSASCNGEHYWTMLFLGENDRITLANNWIHDTSGRSPKVGETITLHAVNNFFDTNGGLVSLLLAGANCVSHSLTKTHTVTTSMSKPAPKSSSKATFSKTAKRPSQLPHLSSPAVCSTSPRLLTRLLALRLLIVLARSTLCLAPETSARLPTLLPWELLERLILCGEPLLRMM
jgi:pectin lyase